MRLLPNGQDEDRNIVALFKQISVPNKAKSDAAGRLICDDMDVCELRFPGSRNTVIQPATGFSHWAEDPVTGEQRKVSYAERFPQQYRQFKEKAQQTKSGTPLDYALFLTEGRRAELRALNIYTIEALAAVDGQELKNLGPQGRDAKNRAIEYIEDSKRGAVSHQMQAELDATRARNMALEEDVKALKARVAAAGETDADGVFDDMSNDQLKDYITANSGQRPLGNPARKTLLRMAESCKPRSEVA